MQVKAIKTKVFREHENLLEFVGQYVKKLDEKSILVIASKLVSLSEGRTLPHQSEEQKIKLIEKESDAVLKGTKLTVKDNMVMYAAGVDESNGDGKLILLPRDSFKTTAALRRALQKKYKIKNLGVLITDSRLFPLRAGVTGAALGYAGFQGVRNYVGKKDIFGRVLKMSRTNVADSLAASAALCMGEGNEQQPLAVITDVPVVFTEKSKKSEVVMDSKKDMYAPLLSILKKTKK